MLSRKSPALAYLGPGYHMRVLPTIVVSQFLCTSLWFAGSIAATETITRQGLSPRYLANLTSAVQAGFIAGTFLFAMLRVSDRFSPSRVFFTCAILGAMVNFGIMVPGSPLILIGARATTGFLLAGVYPVGMKIAADYYPNGLGRALGLLVGALVAGTALPHLLKAFPDTFPLHYLITATSILSVVGGTGILLLVPDGPYRQRAKRFEPAALFAAFRVPAFRAAALGYFGHMWELYAFWAFVPMMLQWYSNLHGLKLNVPLMAFCMIGSGALACVVSGYLSQYIKAGRVATIALALSGVCCLLSPFVLQSTQSGLFIGFLFFWSLVVIADSPMFSSLVATYADADVRGSVLTLVNCVGFAITIVSIQLLNALAVTISLPNRYVVLGLGPAFGVVALLRSGIRVAA